jgi:hypothetical protein
MTSGLDYYSGATINPADIAAANYSFVCRYVDNPVYGLGAKDITQVEYYELIRAGLSVYLVFEHTAQDYAAGFLGGVVNAQRALAGAQWLDYSGPIFMSVDTHLDAQQIPVAISYLDGAQHILATKLGVYGFSELIQACQAQNVGAYFWQAGDKPAPNSGVHLWQENNNTVTIDGTPCDVDLMLLPMPPPEEDMTPDQSAMLTALYQYVSGSAEVVPQGTSWPGWQTWPGGSDQSLSATDYLRQANVDITLLKAEIAAIKATMDSLSVGQEGSFGNLSPEDISRIAAAVMESMASKLGGS